MRGLAREEHTEGTLQRGGGTWGAPPTPVVPVAVSAVVEAQTSHSGRAERGHESAFILQLQTQVLI